jgi:asparagine synthase (glutamine-hydrolysing)
LWLIEEPDPVKISIGIPVHWAAEKTAKMNLKVMLAGQGADELFGGYKRYVDEYQLNGVRKAEETILKDITEMHAANLERDFKICNFHNVELRSPFIALRVVRFAMELPLELKIEPSSDSLRKLVLRKTAEKLGLPQAIVNRPKRAIQYATGVNEALRKIAKQNRLSINEYLQKTFLTVQQKMTQHD